VKRRVDRTSEGSPHEEQVWSHENVASRALRHFVNTNYALGTHLLSTYNFPDARVRLVRLLVDTLVLGHPVRSVDETADAVSFVISNPHDVFQQQLKSTKACCNRHLRGRPIASWVAYSPHFDDRLQSCLLERFRMRVFE